MRSAVQVPMFEHGDLGFHARSFLCIISVAPLLLEHFSASQKCHLLLDILVGPLWRENLLGFVFEIEETWVITARRVHENHSFLLKSGHFPGEMKGK